VEVYDKVSDMSWEILVIDFEELTKLLNFVKGEDKLSLIRLEEKFVLLVEDFLQEIGSKS
jgi:hypothetical protein